MADLDCLQPLASIDAPASMDNWELFNGFVEQQAEAQLGANKAAYQLRLACEELFSNIIRHATCADSGASCAHLWVQALSTTEPQPALVLQLEDNGHPFDPQFDHRHRPRHRGPSHWRSGPVPGPDLRGPCGVRLGERA
jgi:anti-sigma regulatory factor (Ser/Thr protein kinase)